MQNIGCSWCPRANIPALQASPVQSTGDSSLLQYHFDLTRRDVTFVRYCCWREHECMSHNDHHLALLNDYFMVVTRQQNVGVRCNYIV